jgi:hypothetical protein
MTLFETRLYSILRKVEGGDGMFTRAFFAGTLVVVVDMMFCQFLFTASWRPGQTLSEVTQALNDLYLGPGVAAYGCAMIMFAAPALIVIKRGGLPIWLGCSAALIAALQLLFIPTTSASRE